MLLDFASRRNRIICQHDILKINPLIHWDYETILKVIKDKKIPYNILHDQGYPSIGCEPCTRAIKEGEDIRAFIVSSKEALNIDGLGKKVVEKFWELKFIRFPQDIFKLNYQRIQKLDGWGKLSASNLKYSIESSKNVTLDKLIYSLGIRHIGQENAKLISDSIKNIENLKKINSSYNFKNFLNIDGIGETQVKSLEMFFSNKVNTNVIKEISNYLTIKEIEKIIDGKLKSKSFLITGKLQGISRAEAKSIIEINSGKILSSVSNKLDYLIIGEKPTMKKVNTAKELKIKILSQEQWKEMLD